MKLKKGDVYKEAKGPRWFRLIELKPSIYGYLNGSLTKVKYDDGVTQLWPTYQLIDQIKKGKLIKIPQLYK